MLEKLAVRVCDVESAVRSALRELLSTAVLPQIGKPALAPFIPLLTAHVGSAMTHISPDVRQASPMAQACAPQLCSLCSRMITPNLNGGAPPSSLFLWMLVCLDCVCKPLSLRHPLNLARLLLFTLLLGASYTSALSIGMGILCHTHQLKPEWNDHVKVMGYPCPCLVVS